MDTNGKEFRKSCEVRFVAAQSKDWRQKFYEAVTRARGETAARELAAAVKVLILRE